MLYRSAVLACGFAAAAHAQYHYVEIPLLPGTVRSAALGVNNNGDTVGWCRAANNVYYAFLYRLETAELVNLGPIGSAGPGYELGAHDINDNGVIVGAMSVSAPGGLRSFYIEDDDFYNISYAPTPNAIVLSGAFGVNAQGLVAGINTSLCTSGVSTVTAAVIWTDPTDPQTPPSAVMSTPYACGIGGHAHGLTDGGMAFGSVQITTDGLTWETAVAGSRHLPSFSAPRGHASVRDMSNSGFACGSAENRDASGPPTGPCYWDPAGTIHRFPTPSSTIFGHAGAINESLHAVGWTMFTGLRAAALWTIDTPAVTNLNTLLLNPPAGFTLTTAEDISDTGFIVGRMNETVATARAFLLAPCAITITTQPTPVQTCRGGVAEFTVSAPGPNRTFRWQVNTGTPQSPLWCDLISTPASCTQASQAVMAGAATAHLTLTNLSAADAREYRCLITGDCGALASAPAALTLCAPDTTCDGFLDFFDYDEFVTAFESGDPIADFNGDGFLDFFDYDDFVLAFEFGC